MTEYVASLVMGVAVGVAYGLIQIRSPAPPLIALVGLLGMVLGEHAGIMSRHYFAPKSESVQPVRGGVEPPFGPFSNSIRDAKDEGVEL